MVSETDGERDDGQDRVREAGGRQHGRAGDIDVLHRVDSPARVHDAVTRLAALGDPLRRVYRAIDEAVGEVLAVAGDATVVVFAAHGMSHRFGAQFLLAEVLQRLAVTAPPAAGDDAEPVLRTAAARVWRRLPSRVRSGLRRVRDSLTRLRPAARPLPAIAADPARGLCFPLSNGLAAGGIRLNLVGREPRGTLRPGPDAAAFCDRLATDLLAIVDDCTGAPLARRVLRTADLYDGEHLDHLPDLLVEWSEEVAVGSTSLAGGAGARVRARSPKIGAVEGGNTYTRSGEHRAGGWFVAAGPTVAPGRLGRAVSLMDLAPTFTQMLGVELDDCDGRPVAELLRAGG